MTPWTGAGVDKAAAEEEGSGTEEQEEEVTMGL
jgi:hypothetical protein